jgi:hypothetical protein
MFSRKLHLERHFLCFIAHNTNYPQIQAALYKVDRQQYMVLREIAVNILEDVIEIDDHTKEILQVHKNLLRKLANDRLPKKCLLQEAGIITEIVRLALQFNTDS